MRFPLFYASQLFLNALFLPIHELIVASLGTDSNWAASGVLLLWGLLDIAVVVFLSHCWFQALCLSAPFYADWGFTWGLFLGLVVTWSFAVMMFVLVNKSVEPLCMVCSCLRHLRMWLVWLLMFCCSLDVDVGMSSVVACMEALVLKQDCRMQGVLQIVLLEVVESFLQWPWM